MCRLRYLFIICIYLVYEFLRYSIPCHIIVPLAARTVERIFHKMVWFVFYLVPDAMLAVVAKVVWILGWCP